MQIIGKMVYYLPYVGVLHVLFFQLGLEGLRSVLSVPFMALAAALLVKGFGPRENGGPLVLILSLSER